MPSPDRAALALEDLKAGLASGQLAHAYLIVGSPREEGLAFARSVAQMVLCRGLTPPCGACDACDRVARRVHPDVVWLEPEKKSRIISVELMRQAISQLAQTSYEGGWKVAVLLHADRLNESSANAFLKTLEEPPPRTLILLVSEHPQGLLPTIISRCQRIQLSLGDRPVLHPWTEELLDLLARPAGPGALDRMAQARQVQALLDAERKRIEKAVDAELKASDEPVDKEVREARIEAPVRQVRADLLQTMLLWHRDVLLLAMGGDPALLHFPDRRAAASSAAKREHAASLVTTIFGVETLIRRLERNVKPEILSFEACFLTRENISV